MKEGKKPLIKKAYVFVGNENLGDDKLRSLVSKKVPMEDIERVADSIYYTDTTETIHYKIAKKCFKSPSSVDDMYLWGEATYNDDEARLFIQNLYKNELKLKRSRINKIANAFFNKDVYDKNEEDEFVFRDDFITVFEKEKRTKINKSINFNYKDTNDFEVFVSPNPFDEVNDTNQTSVYTSFSKSILSTFRLKDNVLNVVKKNSYIDPTYFKNNIKYNASVAEMIEYRSKTQSQFDDKLSVLHDNFNRIETLSFRVLPHSHEIELDLSTIFKISRTNYDIPIIVHKAKYTNHYKVNKLALHDMDKKIVKEFEEKEMKYRDNVINRSNEVIIYYIKLTDSVFFYMLLSSNGSYRIKYKMNNSMVINMSDIQDSFSKLDFIYEALDNSQIHTLKPDIKLFGSPMIDIIDYNTNNTLTFKSKIKAEPFYNSISNNPFFANLKLIGKSKHSFQFIETNNYYNTDAITTFLYRNLELDRKELIDKMKHQFKISEEEAKDLYEERRSKVQLRVTRKGKNVFAVRPFHTAVNVKLNILSDYSVRIHTTNTQDSFYQKLILFLLTQFLSQKIILKKEVNLDEGSTINDDDMTFGDLQDWDENNDTDDVDFNDIFENVDIPIINNEIDLEDAEFDTEDDVDEENDETMMDDEEELKKGKKKSDRTTFVLFKLYEADRKLFRWKGTSTKLNNYSSKCGTVDYRQPVVVSKEELNHIDTTQPGSYTGYVQTGSTPELAKKNFYICPKIWCRVSRVSITEEAYKKYGNKCPPPHGEDAMWFPPRDAKKNYFINKDGVEAHYPALLNESKHPHNLRLPCCGKKPFVEEDNKKVMTNYIANIASDMTLNDKQRGNLPQVLNVLLNQKASCVGQLDSQSKCYVRLGVDNTKNAMMRAIGRVLKIDDIVDHISKNLTMEHFITMNGGHTAKLFMDSNKQFQLSDKTSFKIFKVYLQNNTEYVKRFGLVKELEYVEANESITDDIIINSKSNPLILSIVREYLLFESFINFKTYMLEDGIDKQLDDVRHLLTYSFMNPKKINFLFIEILNDEAYFLNSRYFHFGDYFDAEQPSALILKIGDHYENVGYVTNKQRDVSKELHFSTQSIEHILKQILIKATSSIKYDTENDKPKPKTYVLSYGLKCVAVIDNKKITLLDKPEGLQYEKISKDSTFMFVDKIAKKHVKDIGEEVQNMIDDAKTNMEIFVQSVRKTRGTLHVEDDVEREYNNRLYAIAKKFISTKKLGNAIYVLNHSLSNFSMDEKKFLIKKILKQNKLVDDSDAIDEDRLAHDLIHLPLKYIVSQYRLNTHTEDSNEVILSYNDILSSMLKRIKDDFQVNQYRMFDKSIDDFVVEKEYMKLDSQDIPATAKKPNFLTIDRIPIKPVVIQRQFPGFEVVDEDLSYSKLIELFYRLDNSLTQKDFEDTLSKKILKMYVDDKSRLEELYSHNLNMKKQGIGKKSTVNDYIGLISKDNYFYSFFELAVLSKMTKHNLVILGRNTQVVKNGIRLINNKSEKYVIMMYYIHADKHTFKLVTVVDELKLSYGVSDFTSDQLKLFE